jgi:hypothetical protein
VRAVCDDGVVRRRLIGLRTRTDRMRKAMSCVVVVNVPRATGNRQG